VGRRVEFGRMTVFGASGPLPVAPSEGPQAEPRADAPAGRWELVKMPRSRRSRRANNWLVC